MNKRDLKQVEQLYLILNAIPQPSGGGASTGSVASFVQYASDMKVFHTALQHYYLNVQIYERWFKSYTEDEFEAKMGCPRSESFPMYVDPRVIVSGIEEWADKRRNNNWAVDNGFNIVFPYYYDEEDGD